MKSRIKELSPLFSLALIQLAMCFFIESIFVPDDVIVPWIYLANVLPWFLSIGAMYCLQLRLKTWRPLWRMFFITVVGVILVSPLIEICQDVNDEIGARRNALAGQEDPYDLYSDESGMRNPGIKMLAHDIGTSFVGGLEFAAFLALPFLIVWGFLHRNQIKSMILRSRVSDNLSP